MLRKAFWAAKSILSLTAGEAKCRPAGWHGELKLPILAASDIISRLGMRLPSNRDVVRPDPDVA